MWIGRFRLLGRLGQGGMGIVYLADGGDGRLAALKVLREELAADDIVRARFAREVDAARRVAPFCTAAVLDADLDGRPPWIASEYVTGRTLQATVEEGGPLAPSSLLALAVGVAGALAAIHAAGVVHRDLKPGNILLGPVGPRVIDFGIAQLEGAGRLTAARRHPGTPAFMAPEQHEGRGVGPAADVFSWGAVVAYAGTGRLPFPAATMAGVAYRVVYGLPELAGLDGDLLTLVTAALAKDPAARPRASQLLAGLTTSSGPGGDQGTSVAGVLEAAAAPAAVPVAAAVSETVPAVVWEQRGRDRRAGRRRPLLLALGAAALVLAVVAAVLVAVLLDAGGRPTSTTTTPPPTTTAGQPVAPVAPTTAPPTTRPVSLPAPAELPKAKLLLFDDFSVKANGWPEESYSEGLGTRSQYTGGRLLLGTRSDDFYPVEPELTPDDSLRSVHVELDVAFGGPNRAATFQLTCPDIDRVARMELRRDGRWRIFGQVATEPDESVLRQGTVGLREGANRVAFTCVGGGPDKAIFALSVNGVRLARFTAADVRVGESFHVGVAVAAPAVDKDSAGGPEPEAVIVIDDIAVWGVTG
jgi:hypothetical protein